MKRAVEAVFLACMLCGSTFAQQPAIRSSLTDSRDGKTYRTVRIGNLTWMAENLNYSTDNSWCYEDDSSNCDKYGRLYDWNTAMKVCPAGWRLPSRRDWDGLGRAVGGVRSIHSSGSIRWDGAGAKLKSTSSWEVASWQRDGNGTDDYAFSAMPGGAGSNGRFRFVGRYGSWWSITADNRSADPAYGDWWWSKGRGEREGSYALNWYVSSGDGVMYEDGSPTTYGLSVRCVKK